MPKDIEPKLKNISDYLNTLSYQIGDICKKIKILKKNHISNIIAINITFRRI